ncbi:hypothetical protein IT568_11490 [bacterium]|nr:hypothetical protein [bacterium]
MGKLIKTLALPLVLTNLIAVFIFWSVLGLIPKIYSQEKSDFKESLKNDLGEDFTKINVDTLVFESRVSIFRVSSQQKSLGLVCRVKSKGLRNKMVFRIILSEEGEILLFRFLESETFWKENFDLAINYFLPSLNGKNILELDENCVSNIKTPLFMKSSLWNCILRTQNAYKKINKLD